jgi:phosphopantetheine--protein transferase-like protein
LPEILGIGTDIEEIRRFHKHIINKQQVSPLIEDIFSQREILQNLVSENPYLCFTLGFSCKESTFKALGKSWMNAPIIWQEIELIFESEPGKGQLSIELSGGAKNLFTEKGGSRIEGEFETENDHITFRVIIWK